MAFRDSPWSERLRDAAIMWTWSWLAVMVHQWTTGNNIEWIINSSWFETALGFLSSSLNLWLYNSFKKNGHKFTTLTEWQINWLSMLAISIGSVWLSRYLLHTKINTKNSEQLAMFYAVWNMLYMYLYETFALKHEGINKIILAMKQSIRKLRAPISKKKK